MADYALYKGEEFIDLGSKEYLAKKINVTKDTISFYATPSYRRRCKKDGKSYIVIKIEKEKEI